MGLMTLVWNEGVVIPYILEGISMNSMKKIGMLVLVCMLGVSTTYAGGRMPKMKKLGKFVLQVERKIGAFSRKTSTGLTSRKTPKISKEGSAATQMTNRRVPTGSLTPRPTFNVRQHVEQASLLTGNTLSRPMQRRIAVEARSYLDELGWKKTPRQPATYSDVNSGIYTLGNLTRMSEEQYALGKKAYEEAVAYMQERSKSINAEIYYLGTSEMEPLVPEQIRRRLGEISEGQALVKDARAIWGDNYVLVRIATYWNKMQEVYSALGTGVLSIEEGKLHAIKRSDGHTYVAGEFGLVSEGPMPELPRPDWKNPTSWWGQTLGELPERLRVAVLQDDREVIRSLNDMRKRAGLKGWTLDVYDDPEAFLNNVAYKDYDMILTDVLIRNGGGRYLARQLRNKGYEGSILTLSGFEEMHGGEEFFNDGIDGMIGLGWTPDLTERIWARLNTYFMLKKKYNWQH